MTKIPEGHKAGQGSEGNPRQRKFTYTQSAFLSLDPETKAAKFKVTRINNTNGKTETGTIPVPKERVLAKIQAAQKAGQVPEGDYLNSANLGEVISAYREAGLLANENQTDPELPRTRAESIAQVPEAPADEVTVNDVANGLQAAAEKEFAAIDLEQVLLGSRKAIGEETLNYFKDIFDREIDDVLGMVKAMAPVFNLVLDRADITEDAAVAQHLESQQKDKVARAMTAIGSAMATNSLSADSNEQQFLKGINNKHHSLTEDLLYGFTAQAFARIKDKETGGHARPEAIDKAYKAFIEKLIILSYMARTEPDPAPVKKTQK